MAPLAADPPAEKYRAVLRLLEPFPGRLGYASRLAVICALTALVTAIFQTPDPALTIYIVFFLNRVDRTTSLIVNLALTVVITVLIGLVFLVARAVLDDAMWRVASMAAISFILLFLVSASKLRPLGSIFALIIAYAMDLLGSAQLGEEATRALLYAWLFVGIPAGVSFVVNLLTAPAPRRLAERAIARRLELCAAVLQGPHEKERREFRECLGEGVGEILHWLKLAGVEKTAAPRDIAALTQAAASCVVLLGAIDLMDRHPEARLAADAEQSLARLLLEMADILKAGSYPLDVDWTPAPPEAADASPVGVLLPGRIQAALRHFAEPATQEAAKPAEAKAEKSGGFLAADAFTNPDHLHYALKTTAAAMFCYALYSLLAWPGIHTCLITCYIVSLSTAAETVEKLSLRILGCVIGAAAGLATMIFLIPHLTTVGGLMAVVFLGTLASAWVAAGSPRIAYAGFQIAFAFLLSVVQGAGPSFDMVTARDRVIGILVGIAVVYLLSTRLWPVSVARRVDPALASVIRRLQAILAAQDPQARSLRASEVQASLTALEADLNLVHYEPPLIRPAPEWLTARLDAAHLLTSMVPALLLAENADSAWDRSAWDRNVEDRLNRFADHLSDSREDTGPEPAASTTDDPLRRLLSRQLGELERTLAARADHGAYNRYATA